MVDVGLVEDEKTVMGVCEGFDGDGRVLLVVLFDVERELF